MARSFWRHERRGEFLLARVLCFVLGHDFEYDEELHGVDADGVFVSDEDAVDYVQTRGDCRRCWA